MSKFVVVVSDQQDREVTIRIRELAQFFQNDPEAHAQLIADMVNTYGNPVKRGTEVGIMLQHAHRTLQTMAYKFALGIVVGIGKDVNVETGTDPRNETAVRMSQKIAATMASGELEHPALI